MIVWFRRFGMRLDRFLNCVEVCDLVENVRNNESRSVLMVCCGKWMCIENFFEF